MNQNRYKLYIGGGLLLALLPLVIVFLLFNVVGSVIGCSQVEQTPLGGYHCVIGGTDYGGQIEMAGLFSFASLLLTVPVGGVIAAIGFGKRKAYTVTAPNTPLRPKRARSLLIVGILLIVLPYLLRLFLSVFAFGLDSHPGFRSVDVYVGSLLPIVQIGGVVLLIAGVYRLSKNRESRSTRPQ